MRIRLITALFLVLFGLVVGIKLPRNQDRLASCEQRLELSNFVRAKRTAQVDQLLMRISAIKDGNSSESATAWNNYKQLGEEINRAKTAGESGK